MLAVYKRNQAFAPSQQHFSSLMWKSTKKEQYILLKRRYNPVKGQCQKRGRCGFMRKWLRTSTRLP